MKVLQFTASSGAGGLEKHVVELTNGLHSSGVEVVFLGSGDLIKRIIPDISCFSINPAKSRWSPALHRDLYEVIKRERPDIVHVHGVKAASILLRVMKVVGSTKSLITIHNTRNKSKDMVAKFDGVIGVSDKILVTVANSNRWRIYNGVNFFPSEESYRGDHLLAVGRLVYDKGFDVLIRSVAETGATLQIAGDGPEKEALIALTNQLGIQSQIKFLGSVENVQDLMRGCMGVVISSRNEGFSYVFAEALATFTPIISTDVPVANEVLPEHMICPVDDVDALSQLIKQLNPMDPCYGKMYRFAKDCFSLDSMISSTSNVYRCLLGV